MDLLSYHPETVRRVALEISRAAGIPAGDAEVFVDSMVTANLLGIDTHGICRLATYIGRIRRGLVDPSSPMEVVAETPSLTAIDGKNGIGQVLGVRAMKVAAEKAGKTGVGVTTVRGSQHFGALCYYCRVATEEGLIGFALTNAEPAVPPWGGKEACLGTNPIALGCPTARGWPIMIDVSTSLVARGRIITASRRAEPIPSGWAIGPDGRPTTDSREALEGALLPMAGHKGYALALLVEILCGVLSGARLDGPLRSMYKDLEQPANVSHFMLALDPGFFMPPAMFRKAVEQLIDEIKGAARMPGVREIFLPGERKHATMTRRRAEGIPLDRAVVEELGDLCDQLDILFQLEPMDSPQRDTSYPGRAKVEDAPDPRRRG